MISERFPVLDSKHRELVNFLFEGSQRSEELLFDFEKYGRRTKVRDNFLKITGLHKTNNPKYDTYTALSAGFIGIAPYTAKENNKDTNFLY